MNKIKHVIFDLDGTLLNTISDITNSVNYALDKFYLANRTDEEVMKFLGYGSVHLINHASNFHPLSSEILKIYNKRYLKHSNKLTKPYEGIISLLEELKNIGYKLSIVSNKEDKFVSNLVVKHFKNTFDIIIGEREDLLKKPSPEMLNYVNNKLGFPHYEAVFIGDSEVDIQTAKNANIDVVAVTWGFRDFDTLKKHEPNFIIDNPIDLVDILKILNN